MEKLLRNLQARRILRNLKVGKKLVILNAISILFIGVVGITGYNYMSEMAKNSEEMYAEQLLPVKWLGQFRTNGRAIDSFLLELMITNDPATQNDLDTQIKDRLNQTKKIIDDYGKTQLDSFENGKLTQLKEKYQQYESQLQQVIRLTKEDKNSDAYNLYAQNLKKLRSEINKLAQELGDYDEKQADNLHQLNQNARKEASVIMFVITLLAVGLCSMVGFWITRMITNPLKELQTLMTKAEKGDLTITGTYQSNDEIGLLSKSFNEMVHGLRGLVQQVMETSEQVAASSEELTASAEQTNKATEQIASTIQEVALGAEKQFQSVEETSKNIKEMSTGVEQIADNAQNVSATAALASEKAFEGNQAIQSAIQQMNSINQTVSGLAQLIKGLGDRSKEIGKITDVITEISSQTNLLALNAAIEAARAGENGRGFAVVANEVRKLADQTAKSAQLISQLIGTIQDETHKAVQEMDRATHEVEEGIKKVNTAGNLFEQIQHSVSEVAGAIQEVSSAVQQMAASSEQILHSIDVIKEAAEVAASGTQNVSAATEEQLASMEEITASATALSKMAEELQGIIGKFKV